MVKQASQFIRNLQGGMIQPVDYSILPVGSCYLSVNFVFNKILGRAILRDGITQVGSQITSGMTCLGLYSHITTTGIKVPLALFNASGGATAVLSKYTSSAWSSAKTGLTASTKMRFETFLDTTVGINGTDAISTADGSNFVTSGGNLDIGNMPKGTMVKEFLDRVYVAGVSGNLDRVYYSGISDGSTVSWTSGNGYIDIEPEEGTGKITALAKVPGYLLIFKERSLKRYDASTTYPESLMLIGTPSQESVVSTNKSCYFFNKRGIYETIGAYPRKISKKIQPIIDAIDPTYYTSVSSWGDGERVFFSIGDITIMDLSLTNCVIMYDIDSQVWTVLSFPKEFTNWGQLVDSNGEDFIIAGDNDGNVQKVMEGTGDNGQSINYILQWHPEEFEQRGRLKDVSRVIVFSKFIRNGNLRCRVDEQGKFEDLGNIQKEYQELKEFKSLKGHTFEFRIQGSGTNCQVIGLEVPDMNINLNFNTENN